MYLLFSDNLPVIVYCGHYICVRHKTDDGFTCPVTKCAEEDGTHKKVYLDDLILNGPFFSIHLSFQIISNVQVSTRPSRKMVSLAWDAMDGILNIMLFIVPSELPFLSFKFAIIYFLAIRGLITEIAFCVCGVPYRRSMKIVKPFPSLRIFRYASINITYSSHILAPSLNLFLPPIFALLIVQIL